MIDIERLQKALNDMKSFGLYEEMQPTWKDRLVNFLGDFIYRMFYLLFIVVLFFKYNIQTAWEDARDR